jgi:hypothetical protein
MATSDSMTFASYIRSKLVNLRAKAAYNSAYIALHANSLEFYSPDIRRKLLLNLFDTKATHSQISKFILGGRPFLISRFGSVELQFLISFYLRNSDFVFSQAASRLISKTNVFSHLLYSNLNTNAGFYPITNDSLQSLYELYMSCLSNVDLLGSWVKGESLLQKSFQNCLVSPLSHFEPFFLDKPWTYALKSKKVLVIHPFAKTILEQYKKRKLLFSNSFILPEFTLSVLQSPQTIGFKSGTHTWFDNLDNLYNKTRGIDFDIAILGCGAYGLPLASMIKSNGKQAIHLGGSTQLLFGIKGKRWSIRPNYKSLYNHHWVLPSADETPSSAHLVENSCYW